MKYIKPGPFIHFLKLFKKNAFLKAGLKTPENSNRYYLLKSVTTRGVWKGAKS